MKGRKMMKEKLNEEKWWDKTKEKKENDEEKMGWMKIIENVGRDKWRENRKMMKEKWNEWK